MTRRLALPVLLALALFLLATPRSAVVGPPAGASGDSPRLSGAPQADLWCCANSPAAGGAPSLEPTPVASGPVEQADMPPAEMIYAGDASLITLEGIIGYAVPSLGRHYLATPWPVGSWVRVCAPGGCVTRRSTDSGPSLAMQRAGRVADLASGDWETISGVALRYGLTQGVLTLVGRP